MGTAVTGQGLAAADAYINNASEVVTQARPHADNTGKAFIDAGLRSMSEAVASIGIAADANTAIATRIETMQRKIDSLEDDVEDYDGAILGGKGQRFYNIGRIILYVGVPAILIGLEVGGYLLKAGPVGSISTGFLRIAYAILRGVLGSVVGGIGKLIGKIFSKATSGRQPGG